MTSTRREWHITESKKNQGIWNSGSQRRKWGGQPKIFVGSAPKHLLKFLDFFWNFN